MAEQGHTQICAARLFAIAEFYAAADAATQQYFQDAEARAAAKAPRAWADCESLIAHAASSGADQQKDISRQAADAARIEAHLQSVQDRARAAAEAERAAAVGDPVTPAAATQAGAHAVNKAAADTTAGWGIESTYCPSAGEGAQRLAEAAAAVLGRLSDAHQRVGGEILGLVNVAPAPRQVVGNAILYDSEEKAFATALQATLAGHGLRYRLAPNDVDGSAWRVSLYACAAGPAPAAAAPAIVAAATAPAAAAPSAPAGRLAAAGQATFEVNFPYHKLILEDDARAVLVDVAQTARRTHASAITITSYDASADLGVMKTLWMARRTNEIQNTLQKRLPGVTVAPAVAVPAREGQQTQWVEVKLGG